MNTVPLSAVAANVSTRTSKQPLEKLRAKDVAFITFFACVVVFLDPLLKAQGVTLPLRMSAVGGIVLLTGWLAGRFRKKDAAPRRMSLGAAVVLGGCVGCVSFLSHTLFGW